MGHYDLSRMGWQQFEHMLQALAKAELGNGVRPFGAGRDGQRDATFNGRLDFPKGAGETWTGYGVIQMKYNERPTSTTKDWQWFLEEVRKELRGWMGKKRIGETTPKYLLFATNVALTGTKDTGGKDQFESTMIAAAADLELDGWYVWDYDEIRTMLDSHTGIRQRYLELIVTGDFLLRLEELLPKTTAVEVERLAHHAVSELINRQWVRTGDAGYSDSSKVRLADIAIDLPCEIEWDESDPSDRMMTAAQTMKIGDGNHSILDGGRGPNGVVIVGGPGQGKSTIAQVIAHGYRVAFLEEADLHRYGVNAQNAFDGLKARLSAASIPPPDRRRWPFVVELAKAGAVLAKSDMPFSLLSYIAESIIVGGHPADPRALLDWMKSWPVCLILDGLDEIPNARARTKLVDAISALVSELSAEGVDLLIVATTRPQGYRREFSDALPCIQLDLLEFTETEALSYSEALTKLRSAHDPDLAEQVAERLITAVHQRVTQRLMTSPLQVTIMTALAEEAVDLPTDRFELFDRYYRVIFDRELAKSEAFGELKSLRPHIDHLHEQAGIRLQARSENERNSDAVLSKSEISRLLRRRLQESGFDEGESDSLAAAVLKLSTERLVMLVSRKSTKYEFEVRSLQEYMAARALTDGDEAQVLENMRALVASSHWRNTWMLAAGRLLKRREYLKEKLVEMVVTYDADVAETSITALGADLAGGLYVDNLGSEFPLIRRQLLESAMAQFADTALSVPRDLSDLLDTALGQSEKEVTIALDALHTLSRANSSNLATQVLHENRTGMTPLAKRARTTLTEGRTYVRPEKRTGQANAVALSRAVEKLSTDGQAPDGMLLAEQLRRAGAVSGSPEPLASISLDLLGALESEGARSVLAAAVKRVAQGDPSAAALGMTLLRMYASRAVRGHLLAS